MRSIIKLLLLIWLNFLNGGSPPSKVDEKMARNSLFSGVYSPTIHYNSTSLETFAGAWFVSKRRLLHTGRNYRIDDISNIEGAVFTIILNPPNAQMMTRDYFDFFVLHLSSMTNEMPELKTNGEFRKALYDMMSWTCDTLRRYVQKTMGNITSFNHRFRNQTVAVIPYSSVPGTQKINATVESSFAKYISLIRVLFLKATIYSIYRYFPRIIVAFASSEDLEHIKSLNMPIWMYLDFSFECNSDAYGRKVLLPKYALMHVRKHLNQTYLMTQPSDVKERWKQIQYVYYSESDQILYARKMSKLLKAVDDMQGIFSLIPHRMHTTSLPKSVPSLQYSESWTNGWTMLRYNLLKDVKFIVEDPIIPKGSCCDAGRFMFAKCEADRWFKCSKYGLQNYSQWLRFGEQGYTLPTGTVHAGKCDYVPSKVLCPLPPQCERRMPRKLKIRDFCDEFPSIINIP